MIILVGKSRNDDDVRSVRVTVLAQRIPKRVKAEPVARRCPRRQETDLGHGGCRLRLDSVRRAEEATSHERDEGPAWERMAGAGSEISRLHGGAIVAERRRVGQGEAGADLLRLTAQARVGEFWAIRRGLASSRAGGR